MAHWPSATGWDFSAERSPNEGDLVRAARNGDKEAFQQLIFRYDRLVLTLGLHLTGSEDEARHLYERVFLTAFNTLPVSNVEASFFLWIYRIAVQCCQEHLQMTSRSAIGTESLPLSRLSTRERLVFVLAHYSRLRMTTIAVILNISETSVKDALARAFFKLRTENAA